MNSVRLALILAAIISGLTACSSSSQPRLPANVQDDLAPGRAEPCVLQFVLDTGMVPSAEMMPTAVGKDGVLLENADTRLLYQREVTLYIGPHRGATVGSETGVIAGFLELVPGLQSSKGLPKGKPTLTADQAADAAVVQELAGAGYLDARTFGAAQAGSPIQPGPNVDAWVIAHGSAPLIPGVSTTIAAEKQRTLSFIAEPLPTQSAK
jgi:hypothetical protein